MVWPSAFRVLFLIYCVEAGVFLLLAPWSAGWDRNMLLWNAGAFESVWLHPAFRGGVSGFGLVHLVWGAHDLDLWLSSRRASGSRSSAGSRSGAEDEP